MAWQGKARQGKEKKTNALQGTSSPTHQSAVFLRMSLARKVSRHLSTLRQSRTPYFTPGLPIITHKAVKY